MRLFWLLNVLKWQEIDPSLLCKTVLDIQIAHLEEDEESA